MYLGLNEKLERCKEEIYSCIHNIMKIIDDAESIVNKDLQQHLKDLEEIKRRIKEEKVTIAFLGEYNAGKSSLINTIFNLSGEYELRVGSIPTTDRVYIVTYGEVKDRMEKGDIVELIIPEPKLKNFKVIDSPGTNSIYEEHTKQAMDTIVKADFMIFISQAGQALSQSQVEFIKKIVDKGGTILIFVLNKSDLINIDEREKIENYVKNEMIKHGLGDIKLLFVSTEKGENIEKLNKEVFDKADKLAQS